MHQTRKDTSIIIIVLEKGMKIYKGPYPWGVTVCYSVFPFVALCYPVLPLNCYPVFSRVPLCYHGLPLCYPCYPLLPLVTLGNP